MFSVITQVKVSSFVGVSGFLWFLDKVGLNWVPMRIPRCSVAGELAFVINSISARVFRRPRKSTRPWATESARGLQGLALCTRPPVNLGLPNPVGALKMKGRFLRNLWSSKALHTTLSQRMHSFRRENSPYNPDQYTYSPYFFYIFSGTEKENLFNTWEWLKLEIISFVLLSLIFDSAVTLKG